MKSKYFLFTWLITAVILFILNGIFHGAVAANFFDSHLAALGNVVVKMKDFKPLPVIILELVLDGCLMLIITRGKNEPVKTNEAIITGGLFYLCTAAAWNLANTATFVSWPVDVTIADTCWHFISGLFAGFIICKVFNRHFKHYKMHSPVS